MDLSKLPKLSDTPRPAAQPDPTPADKPADTYAAAPVPSRPGAGAEAWLSIVLGILLILMNIRFANYVFATLTGSEFHTNVNWTSGELAGQEVKYWDLQGLTAWTECALFLFGLAMVFEGLVLLLICSQRQPRASAIALALLITVAATALNLIVSVRLFALGVLPLMSGLAVAFGGYIAAYEWGLFKLFRNAPKSA